MYVKDIRFEIDNRFGPQYEYEHGQPVRFKTTYLAQATVKYEPSVTLNVYLSADDCQKIIDIVLAAAQREIDSILAKVQEV